MSIKELKEKIKTLRGRVVENEKDLYIALLVGVVALGAFGLGRLSTLVGPGSPVGFAMVDLDSASQAAAIAVVVERGGTVTPGKIAESQATPAPAQASLGSVKAEAPKSSALATSGKIVASKNGTKYHLPECSGAKRIKDENKVWFDSVEAAQAAGYSAAANCPGL